MQMPGFTAELSIQISTKTAFYARRPAGSAPAKIAPQLFIGTRPPQCSWPCRLTPQGQCICPF